MKVLEVIEPDFINQESSLDHLFRVQKARCSEVIIYIQALKAKYPSLPSSWFPSLSSSSLSLSSSSWLSSLSSSSSSSLLSSSSSFLEQDGVSKPEINKFEVKWKRMINAKKSYEDAGGKY